MARLPEIIDSAAPARPAPSTSERVAETIVRGLLLRDYAVGQRLVEPDLMAMHQVSRSTVREALKILASRGIVETVPHRGATIRSLSRADAINLLAVLEVLTGLAARLAAQKIHVGRNASRFEAAAQPLVRPRPGELDRLLDERARFHQCMLDIADNAELNLAMPTSRVHLFRMQVRSLLTQADLRAMVAEYRQITEAVLAGDDVRAEQAARHHVQRSAERSMPHFCEGPRRPEDQGVRAGPDRPAGEAGAGADAA